MDAAQLEPELLHEKNATRRVSFGLFGIFCGSVFKTNKTAYGFATLTL